ncbi:tetratricopeptide repeat protein [Temperatibacter marinus]|uniref:Tetratricopeptide repeat protein n=1 Tax=Temperatibacter marinus TaxID=1456591 RepID=A0AA52EEM5_9PROT|nr:tetratricopeptide repeat protein [Temperatibacter marinus]WND03391.1 tetratricopeptide repeat protein [Temperatibacter marinus]
MLNIGKLVVISAFVPLVSGCSGLSGPSFDNADVTALRQAKPNMQRAHTEDPQVSSSEYRRNLYNTALILARKGDHQAAIPIFRHSLASSDTLERRTALASSLVAVGQHQEAAQLLQEVTNAGTGHGETWYTLGKSWLALGRYDEALAAFSEASNRLTGDPRPRSARGVTFAAMGNISSALNSFDMALKVRSQDRETLSNKALVQALSDNEGAAIEILETLVDTEQADPRDRQNLALAYLMQGEDEKAHAIGRIDLDQETLTDTFLFYQEIKALPIDYRMRALVSGAVDPAWDSRESANMKLANNDNRIEAAKRIILKPAPEPRPTPPPLPEPVVQEDPVIPPLLEPEGWAVQIGAYRTIKNLVRGWDILKERNADILEGIPPRRSEKDFGPRDSTPSGFYYRLNAGPLENYSAAKILCDAFIERGTDCWIRPPEKPEGKLPSRAENQ